MEGTLKRGMRMTSMFALLALFVFFSFLCFSHMGGSITAFFIMVGGQAFDR
jgi:hypothetical protein